VRRISQGVGVEKVFPLHSPNVVQVEVEASGRARRAKLYFLRERVGKKTKLREKA
jgi:large subunit ribosomal protein L19